jgi:hypothetical protein
LVSSKKCLDEVAFVLYIEKYFEETALTLFDLILIAVFLASVVTLCTAAGLAVFGSAALALRILRVYAICIGAYLAIVLVVSLTQPREILAVGQDKCFDDWCIGVQDFNRSTSSPNTIYHVTIRLSSTAKRVSQRENGVVVYLRDARGRRFDPVPVASDVPLNSLLLAQQSITAMRVFTIPADAEDVGLVIAHEGGFPIGWFIIGTGPFHKDPIVPLR